MTKRTGGLRGEQQHVMEPSIIFLLLSSIFSSASITIPNPSFGIGKSRYFSSKTFSDIFTPHFGETQAAPGNSFTTAQYSQMGLVPRINDFLFKKSCYLSLKLCYNVFHCAIMYFLCPS